MNLRYRMGSLLGEPTRSAVISWQGEGSIYSVGWIAEVLDKNGNQYVTAGGERVYASYDVGVIPPPGKSGGWDVSGSPAWSQTFATYSGGVSFGVSEAEAKRIYKGCFTLDNARVFAINGKPASTR
jgi:hypothetical protein